MKIIWYGQGCFQIVLKGERKSRIAVVIDPFDSGVKLKAPWKKADALLVTQQSEESEEIKSAQGQPFLIIGPGEYEIKSVFIQGIAVSCKGLKDRKQKEGTIFTIRAENIQLCHLGAFCQGELTLQQLDKIGDVDILMIPIGGVSGINTRQVLKIISQIEPRIVIPMHYQIPGPRTRQKTLDEFLKAFGIESAVPQAVISIKTKDLPKEDETKVLVLKP